MSLRVNPREKRNKKLQIPVSEIEQAEFLAACKTADIDPPDTLRRLVAALVEHVKEHRTFTSPVRLATAKKRTE